MKIGYARVSTGDQSLALQVDALKKAKCRKVFQEKVSGSKPDRVEFGRLLEVVRDGDVVVVWRLDRMARSLKHLISVVEDLQDRGVGFCSLSENIDTTTPGGELVFHIFGALAQFERSVIVDRTKAGLAAARVRGRIGGRPSAMSEKDIKRAKELRAKHHTMASIAKRFGVDRSTLYRNLRE